MQFIEAQPNKPKPGIFPMLPRRCNIIIRALRVALGQFHWPQQYCDNKGSIETTWE